MTPTRKPALTNDEAQELCDHWNARHGGRTVFVRVDEDDGCYFGYALGTALRIGQLPQIIACAGRETGPVDLSNVTEQL